MQSTTPQLRTRNSQKRETEILVKKFFKQVVSFFQKHRQINSLIICLCISFFLWLFVTYGRDYQHSISYTLKFTDNEHKVEYFTQDSVITVGVKTNGFEFLAKSSARNKKNIVIDVDKLNINLSKGNAAVPSSQLKTQIMQNLGYRGVDITVSPATINLSWNKLYSKRVKVINTCEFKFERPYGNYSEPELMTQDVVIEGAKSEISKVNSIKTKPIVYNNINKSGIFLVPLDLDLPSGVTCRMKSVPIRIYAEKYTENVAMLPVKVLRYEDYRNIKVLPKQVKVRYRVAVKDFAKVNEKEFNAFVLCSDDAMAKSDKLKVNLSNIPDYVKVVSIYPQKVEYILFK